MVYSSRLALPIPRGRNGSLCSPAVRGARPGKAETFEFSHRLPVTAVFPLPRSQNGSNVPRKCWARTRTSRNNRDNRVESRHRL
jgi:hypothetical protein